MQLGERIRRHRRQNKLTQLEVASRLGVNQATVSKWERGDPIDPHYFKSLAELLETDVASIIGSALDMDVVVVEGPTDAKFMKQLAAKQLAAKKADDLERRIEELEITAFEHTKILREILAQLRRAAPAVKPRGSR